MTRTAQVATSAGPYPVAPVGDGAPALGLFRAGLAGTRTDRYEVLEEVGKQFPKITFYKARALQPLACENCVGWPAVVEKGQHKIKKGSEFLLVDFGEGEPAFYHNMNDYNLPTED